MELALTLLSFLFPSRCILCGQTVSAHADKKNIELCGDCYGALPFNMNYCLRCALPLVDGVSKNTLCGRCVRRLPDHDYAYSLFRYEGDIIRLIHQLKFSEKIICARSIGELLLSVLMEDGALSTERPDCLLPVPLHPSRLRQRGFNQSIEIARVISKKLSIPIEYDAVIRCRRTTAQTGLNASRRQKNIKDAFSVTSELSHRHILIIDDVVTTGSTVNELARVLKNKKVERVGILSIARAPVKG